ncbi:hypothetical protein HK096_004512 [Nowakowskiella sp. JEL0078]|nr:hypothetical protein HK096_004512 [Nowakowskiella sp. JEL0078]
MLTEANRGKDHFQNFELSKKPFSLSVYDPIALFTKQVEETYSTTDEQKVVEVKVDLIKGIHDAAMIRNAKIVTAVNLFLLSEIIPQNEDSAISHERQYAMQKFCTRILSLTKSSRSVIFVSLLYVYRLTTLSSMNSAHMTLFASVQALGLKLTPRQLMTVTLMLAYKYLEDRKFSATAWAKISSIDVNELNSVERECLAALQFNLYVSEQEFLDWKTWLYQFVTRMENQ